MLDNRLREKVLKRRYNYSSASRDRVKRSMPKVGGKPRRAKIIHKRSCSNRPDWAGQNNKSNLVGQSPAVADEHQEIIHIKNVALGWLKDGIIVSRRELNIA